MPFFRDHDANADFPEETTTVGITAFGVIAKVDVGDPAVILRFNGSATDQIVVEPGTIRTVGRPSSRGISTFDAKSTDSEVNSVVQLEFVEQDLDDSIVAVVAGPQGPAGAAGADGADGADGAVGPAGPAGAAGADGVNYGATSSVFAGIEVDQAAPGSSTTKVILDDEVIDAGGDFNATQGEFTAPAAGTYLVMAATDFENATAIQLELHKDTGGGFQAEVRGSVGGINADSSTGSSTLHALVALNEDDTIALFAKNFTATGANLISGAGVKTTYMSVVRVS